VHLHTRVAAILLHRLPPLPEVMLQRQAARIRRGRASVAQRYRLIASGGIPASHIAAAAIAVGVPRPAWLRLHRRGRLQGDHAAARACCTPGELPGGRTGPRRGRLRLVADGHATVLLAVPLPKDPRIEAAGEGVEDSIHVGKHEHVLLHVGPAEALRQAGRGRLALHEVVGRLRTAANRAGAIGIEIPGRLQPFDDLLGLDRQAAAAACSPFCRSRPTIAPPTWLTSATASPVIEVNERSRVGRLRRACRTDRRGGSMRGSSSGVVVVADAEPRPASPASVRRRPA